MTDMLATIQGMVIDGKFNDIEEEVQRAVDAGTDLNRLINDALQYQAERVAPTTPDLIATFRMEDEVIDALRRIYPAYAGVGFRAHRYQHAEPESS